MANELTQANSAGELFENITQSAQFTFNENALLRNLVTVYNMVGTPGLTASVPVWPKVDISAQAALGATALTNTDVSATAVDITAGEYGAMTTIQDIVVESSPIAVAQDVGRVLGDGVAQKMDQVIVDLFGDSGITDLGSTGTELTMDNLLQAAATLRNNGVPMTGLVAVLHPLAAYNLKTSLVNSGTNPSANGLVNAASRDYYIGRVGGIDLFESASISVDSANDAICSVFHPSAIGLVMKRDLRIATQRDESIRGFEVVATAAFGANILDATKIVSFTVNAAL